jgi:hypothetical protein
MKYLADSSMNLLSLNYLSLCCNKIGNIGMKYLSKVSQNWSKLIRLNLYNNNIG